MSVENALKEMKGASDWHKWEINGRRWMDEYGKGKTKSNGCGE